MKASKKNLWLYINSTILLLVLVIFSVFPLVSGIWQVNQEQRNLQSNLNNQEQSVLESEATGYQMVLQREPDNQTALQGLLEVKFKQGDIDGIIPPLERLAEINPMETSYALLLAQTKQQVGDLLGATNAYRSILTNQPGNTFALKGAADLLVKQNLAPDAINLVQDTLKKATDEPDKNINVTSTQLVLAEIYIQQNQKKEALEIYEKAITSDPQDFRPLLAKAIILKGEGKIEEAKTFFKLSESLAPETYKPGITKMAENVTPSSPPVVTPTK